VEFGEDPVTAWQIEQSAENSAGVDRVWLLSKNGTG